MTPAEMAATHAAAFVHERPWAATEFAALLDQPGMILCGDVRSFVLGRVTLDEAEVLTIATDPAQQRQGLARVALADFETTAARKGAVTCFLEVAENNTPARALYALAGYARIGRRPAYYATKAGAPVAALVLQKSLVGG